jgi:hypothetical protein
MPGLWLSLAALFGLVAAIFAKPQISAVEAN